jgi:methanogenic corrinoid protein MtbC1
MSDLHHHFNQTIESRKELLAEKIVQRQYARRKKRWESYGDEGYQKSIRDTKYHLDYLSKAVAGRSPRLFTDYTAWVKVLFGRLGFSPDVLPTTLEITRKVLKENLNPELYALAETYLEAAESDLTAAQESQASVMSPDQPHAELAREYLDLLLAGERAQAARLIMAEVEGGLPVRDIYLHVFQPTQHEVGRLWQINEISVAHEHYCTAATQLIMSQLYPQIMSTEKTGRRMIMTCVNDELHELGARMVADFFEMEGWDTYYLGANTPSADILSALDEKAPDLLGISTTITYHLDKLSSLIQAVRSSPPGQDIPILVGGRPFNIDPDLWEKVGADGHASDAGAALETVEKLFNH